MQTALRQQLAPLEQSRAIGATLERREWRDDAPHHASHPLVGALQQLDALAAHLRDHAHWTNSATHLAQVLATRVRALGMVSSLVTRSVEAQTAAATASLAAGARPPVQPRAPPADSADSAARATAAAGERGSDEGAVANGRVASGGGPDDDGGSSGGGGGGVGGGGVGGGVGGVSASAGDDLSGADTHGDESAQREAAETEVLYLRYRALAEQLRPWIVEVTR